MDRVFSERMICSAQNSISVFCEKEWFPGNVWAAMESVNCPPLSEGGFQPIESTVTGFNKKNGKEGFGF